MPRQNPCKKKIVVGVTGMFGSGKTTVSRVFRSLGAEVIDADRIAHRCVSSDRQTHKRIVRVFGEKILDRHGRISRKKLAVDYWQGSGEIIPTLLLAEVLKSSLLHT